MTWSTRTTKQPDFNDGLLWCSNLQWLLFDSKRGRREGVQIISRKETHSRSCKFAIYQQVLDWKHLLYVSPTEFAQNSFNSHFANFPMSFLVWSHLEERILCILVGDVAKHHGGHLGSPRSAWCQPRGLPNSNLSPFWISPHCTNGHNGLMISLSVLDILMRIHSC